MKIKDLKNFIPFLGDYNLLSNKPTIPDVSNYYTKTEVNGLIPTASDVAYDATSWDGNTNVPTKNAVRDKFESLTSGGLSQAQVRRLNA